MTLTEGFARYDLELQAQGKKLKTRKNYKSAYSSLILAVGDIPMELLSFDHVTRWQLSMSAYMQTSSIKSNLTTLRQVLAYLRKQGLPVIDSRDIELPKVPRKDPIWLDYSEVQGILDVITSSRDKAIVAALFATGARISELLQLNRDSILDGQAHIIGKGDKPRILYFDEYSLNLINEYLATRKDTLRPLFISGQYRRITVSRVEQLLHKYEDMAHIEKNVTPHTFRRTFASDLIFNGAGLYDTAKLLGHAQVATTYNHYAFVRDEYNKRSHEKFHSKLGKA